MEKMDYSNEALSKKLKLLGKDVEVEVWMEIEQMALYIHQEFSKISKNNENDIMKKCSKEDVYKRLIKKGNDPYGTFS